jgi:hypothetical protein
MFAIVMYTFMTIICINYESIYESIEYTIFFIVISINLRSTNLSFGDRRNIAFFFRRRRDNITVFRWWDNQVRNPYSQLIWEKSGRIGLITALLTFYCSSVSTQSDSRTDTFCRRTHWYVLNAVNRHESPQLSGRAVGRPLTHARSAHARARA